jgi:hypothetical protein
VTTIVQLQLFITIFALSPKPKQMKVILSLMVAAVCATNAAMAQTPLEENQFHATITMKDGTSRKGIVEFDAEPYRNQYNIRYFDAKLLETGQPVKGKQKEKISAADLKDITTKDNNRYVVKKYADMSVAGLGNLGKYYILPIVKSGKLSLYNYYEEIGVQPILLVGKEGEEKVKAVGSTAMKPFIEDCQTVKEKFEKGGYGNNPKDDSALMNNNMKFINEIVDEYNASCGAQ